MTPKTDNDPIVREEAAAMDAEGKKIAAAHHAAPQSQSERFVVKARKLGLDERNEIFDAALGNVTRHKSSLPAKKASST